MQQTFLREGGIIEGFKNRIFPLNHDDSVQEQARYEEEEKNVRNENGFIDYKKFGGLIDWKKRDTSDVLVRKNFLIQRSVSIAQKIEKVKK